MQLILPMAVPPPELDDIEFHDPNCWASTGELKVVESLSSLHHFIFGEEKCVKNEGRNCWRFVFKMEGKGWVGPVWNAHRIVKTTTFKRRSTSPS